MQNQMKLVKKVFKCISFGHKLSGRSHILWWVSGQSKSLCGTRQLFYLSSYPLFCLLFFHLTVSFSSLLLFIVSVWPTKMCVQWLTWVLQIRSPFSLPSKQQTYFVIVQILLSWRIYLRCFNVFVAKVQNPVSVMVQ